MCNAFQHKQIEEIQEVSFVEEVQRRLSK